MQDCISTSQIFRKLLVLTRDHNALSTWSFGQLILQLQVGAPIKRLSATLANKCHDLPASSLGMWIPLPWCYPFIFPAAIRSAMDLYKQHRWSIIQVSMVGVSETSTAWAPDVIREQLQAFRSSDDLLSFFSELKDLVHVRHGCTICKLCALHGTCNDSHCMHRSAGKHMPAVQAIKRG